VQDTNSNQLHYGFLALFSLNLPRSLEQKEGKKKQKQKQKTEKEKELKAQRLGNICLCLVWV
jgi:hypothetical protein